MRKILLGTTAVIGAALLAPTMAAAQEAPTVRIGGYFNFLYGHTQQSAGNSFGAVEPVAAQISLPGATNGTAVGTSSSAVGSAKTGKNDFSSDAEIHVFVNGKAANGLTYGAVMELAFDINEGGFTGPARRTFMGKTSSYMDEMYAFIASPTLGQLRVGDEDGPMGGLMNMGIVTNFGTGGVYGYWENFTIRPNRTTTSPGGLGDNTKIIYLSPQFFGFDFGASFALNSGNGQDTGCVTSYASYTCDRVYAATGSSTNALQFLDGGWPQRRNEHQAMLRWRGNLAGVGLGASFGHVGWTPILEMNASGSVTAKVFRPGNVWQAGLQATAYGLTVGANYQWGQSNYFWGSQFRGDKNQEMWTLGASYTAGPFTIGANTFFGSYANSAGRAWNGTALVTNCTATNRTCGNGRRYAYSVGATYRLAPGMDLVAEWTRHVVHEPGTNQAAGTGNVQDKLRTEVLMVGTRLAF